MLAAKSPALPPSLFVTSSTRPKLPVEAGSADHCACERTVDLAVSINGGSARHGASAPSEVQPGFHLPRYAALHTQPSPVLRHSSLRGHTL